MDTCNRFDMVGLRMSALLLNSLVAAVSLTTLLRAADSRPPNVVLIMTDNHGAWTLGCYGNSEIRTPNIDRLAAQGIRFSLHY